VNWNNKMPVDHYVISAVSKINSRKIENPSVKDGFFYNAVSWTA
jgi:hypothetical protein